MGFLGGFVGQMGENIKARQATDLKEQMWEKQVTTDALLSIMRDPNQTEEKQAWAAAQLDTIIGEHGKGKGGAKKGQPQVMFSDLYKQIRTAQPRGTQEKQTIQLPPIPADSTLGQHGMTVPPPVEAAGPFKPLPTLTVAQQRELDYAKAHQQEVAEPAAEAAHVRRMEEMKVRPASFTKKATVTGEMLNEQQKQALAGAGYSFDPRRRYNLLENARGEFQVLPSEERALSAAEVKLKQEIEAYQAANNGMDFETAKRAVLQRRNFEAKQKILERGARITRSQVSTAHINKIIEKANTGEPFTGREARMILSGAQSAARARKADMMDQEAQAMTFDELQDKEIQAFGVTRDELNTALRGKSAGAATPPGWK